MTPRILLIPSDVTIDSLAITDQETSAPLPAWRTCAELSLIFLLCFVVGGGSAPDVNEAHYLAKAKHYWQPTWGQGDAFLESADAHQVFYWSFGWVTRFVSLTAAAWIGRVLVWLLFAWSFRRLSLALLPGKWNSVFAAAVFLMLMRWGHMAGEWVVGGVEAKGLAFPLVFLGLEAIVRGHWRRVWIYLGAASSFHVLVGGWTVLAALLVWAFRRKDRLPLTPMLPWLIVGGLCALPGLWPALRLNAEVDQAIAEQANEIYVHKRLGHHLVVQQFDVMFILRHVGLIVLWGVGWRYFNTAGVGQRRLAGLVWAALGVALVGTVLCAFDQHPTVTGLLRYYWFRLSDVMVPLGITFLLLGLLTQWSSCCAKGAAFGCVVIMSCCVANYAQLSLSRLGDPRSGADRQTLSRHADPELTMLIHQEWLRVCDWVANASEVKSGDRFLTPRRQQTFKWRTGQPEVNCWKDVPQDAASLVAWYRRQLDVYPNAVVISGLDSLTERQLYELCKRYNAKYALLERRNPQRRFAFPRRFPKPGDAPSYYEVYQVLVDRP